MSAIALDRFVVSLYIAIDVRVACACASDTTITITRPVACIYTSSSGQRGAFFVITVRVYITFSDSLLNFTVYLCCSRLM